jgi:hypothetical protein
MRKNINESMFPSKKRKERKYAPVQKEMKKSTVI